MRKKIILILIVLGAVGIAAYNYLYKNHRDISSEEAVEISTQQLISDFEKEEEAANKKYLDKTIQIEGTVTSYDIGAKTVVLDEKVLCLLTKNENCKVSDKITLKGRLLGYDSLLSEVKVDQCSKIEK
jgi:hypothetical protein